MKPITIMLILSACIHLTVLSLLAFLPWFSIKKIYAPVYQVALITQVAPEPKATKPKVRVTKKPSQKPPKKVKKKPVKVKKPKPRKKVALRKKPVTKDIISEKRVRQKMESRIEPTLSARVGRRVLGNRDSVSPRVGVVRNLVGKWKCT